MATGRAPLKDGKVVPVRRVHPYAPLRPRTRGACRISGRRASPQQRLCSDHRGPGGRVVLSRWTLLHTIASRRRFSVAFGGAAGSSRWGGPPSYTAVRTETHKYVEYQTG